MKKIKLIFFLITLTIIFLSGSCIHDGVNSRTNGGNGSLCPMVPDWFSQKDLIGEWVAVDRATGNTDTLTIYSDGTYTQDIEFESSVLDNYYGENYSWSLEIGENHIPYIYLDNYRICAFANETNCDWVDKEGNGWADCCGVKPRKTLPGEMTLTVIGPPNYIDATETRLDLSLVLFRGCESSAWRYKFQE
jgi:hypothetical protein